MPIVLVEEYADGPEISVDCAVYHGEVLPICLAHKEIGYPPYFEEVGHLVDGADPQLADPAFRQLLEQAHQALGFTDGITHTEFRLTPSGPKLIEVNARLGGDLIPYLGLRATGIDPGLAAAAVACGRRPEVIPDRKRFGAVRFCYVPYEMTIGAISFDERPAAGRDRSGGGACRTGPASLAATGRHRLGPDRLHHRGRRHRRAGTRGDHRCRGRPVGGRGSAAGRPGRFPAVTEQSPDAAVAAEAVPAGPMPQTRSALPAMLVRRARTTASGAPGAPRPLRFGLCCSGCSSTGSAASSRPSWCCS